MDKRWPTDSFHSLELQQVHESYLIPWNQIILPHYDGGQKSRIGGRPVGLLMGLAREDFMS